MPCVTHHDACECRMEVVRELAKSLRQVLIYLPEPGMDDSQEESIQRGLAALMSAARLGWVD